MADDVVMMPGKNGGRLRVGGPGRPPSQAAIAIREARYQLKPSLDALVAIRDGGKCQHCGRGAASADEIVKASLGIMKLSRIDKEKPPPRKRATFGVVRASPSEMAEYIDTHPPRGSPVQTVPSAKRAGG